MAKKVTRKKPASRKKPAKKITAVKPDTSKLLVRIIEDQTNKLDVALGLTEENLKRLIKIGKVASEKHNKTSAIMVEISKACNHANELAFLMFVMGVTSPRDRQGQEDEDPFMTFVKAIKKGGGTIHKFKMGPGEHPFGPDFPFGPETPGPGGPQPDPKDKKK